MIKLFKSLFPLCVLLVGGYIQHHGGTFYESINSSTVKNKQYLIVEKKQYSVSKPVLFNQGKNKQNRITDIEEKENEIVSFKKYSLFSNNVNTPFYTQTAEYSFQYTQLHFFFFKLFSYYPSCKSLYLIFEVMRI
ncbi:hypothetical protein DR864_17860 [Runella rosea]|uniref:Uncharacterized protein n=1 Tax=Runella rosea TaxID=2259595 RepID=A0A344TLF4_9BACT|nr:hypothetical protein [Runella rosea]AXE19475.1 hypothetical protein DR864_17860 [Runella rosea]